MIDILMATYNGEKYVGEQIESILNQTYKDFRLIISDDVSTDNTYKIIKEYEKKDKRIKVFKNEKNLGYVKNFENLLKRVESEYFMLSDQDDVWKKDKVEKSFNKIKKENLKLVYSDLCVVDQKLKMLNKSMWKKDHFKNKAINIENFENIMFANFITGCTIIAKSNLINKIIPIPDKPFIHDFWIGVVAIANGKIGYLEESTILYRQHSNNQIGSYKKKNKSESFEEGRNRFIKNKIKQFEIYIKRRNDLNDKMYKYSKYVLEYFKKIKNINKYSFKYSIDFFKIFKYEGYKYKIKMYLALHFPVIANKLYKLYR